MSDIAGARGFTLVESLIACAVLTTALLSAGHLSAAAITRVAEARGRTLATIIAVATLEDLRTAESPSSGGDVVDGEGRPARPDAARRFDRRWSAASISPDVWILTVVVTPLPAGGAGEVRMTGGWTGRP